MKEELDIRDYVKVLRKKRWAAISVFLAVFLFTGLVTFTSKPVYRASALVYIDPGVVTQYTFQQQTYPMDNPSYMQTQMGIIRSESIARNVVARTGLGELARQRDGRGLSFASVLGFFLTAAPKQPAGGKEEAAVKTFLKKLGVETLKNSNLVRVSYEDEDPVLAARIVNETVDTFVKRNLEMKVAPAREAMVWLNDKLDEIRSRMSRSTSELQDFKRDMGLIVTGEKQANISLQALSDLNAKVITAVAKRSEAEVKYQQVRSLSRTEDGLMSMPAVINNGLIQDLKSKESELNNEIAELSKKLGDRHPKMIRVNNEMDALKRKIKTEVELIKESIKNDYEAALKEEQAMKAALAEQKAEAMNYERRSTEYDLMRQDVEGSMEIYDTVLKKFQESNLMGNINMSSVQLLDKAVPPERPVKPRKALNLVLGLLIGSLGGVGFAFLFESLDNTYKTPEDLEEHLGLPILGYVPRMKELKKEGGAKTARMAVADPKSAYAEAFRNIRSNMLLSTVDAGPKVIQICSPLHSEGKSMVSLSVAVILAAAGERVLIMDCDLRKPILHKALNVPHANGLSSFLTGQAELDAIIAPTPFRNLSFISAGPISPNPGELVGSARMAELVKTLRGMFDRVIIDCPPYLGIADASILTPITDGFLLVVRGGSTTKEAAMKTARAINMINARVIGVVLNDVSGRSESQYQYYYKYNYGHYDN